jgi:hypothetical protein
MVRRLLVADWNRPDSPIRLNDKLTLADVGHVPMYRWARRFLELLSEGEGAPLTPGGWLKRKSVARMLAEVEWPAETVERLRDPRLHKVVNEYDLQELEVVRAIFHCVGLARTRKGFLLATRTGRALLPDGSAGALYSTLFRTYFTKLDLHELRYHDEMTEMLEQVMAVTLWRISQVADDWICGAALPEQVLTGPMLALLSDPDRLSGAFRPLQRLVFEPLEWFGLLECRRPEKPTWDDAPVTHYRKTPLYDRFLSFPVLLEGPFGSEN